MDADTQPDKHRIGIVGYGVVARTQHTQFGEDNIEVDRDAADAQREAINAYAVTFICVPTPTRLGAGRAASAVSSFGPAGGGRFFSSSGSPKDPVVRIPACGRGSRSSCWPVWS